MVYKKDIPDHIKSWIVREKKAGKSDVEVSEVVSRVYKVARSSVGRIFNRWKKEKSVARRKRKGGRPKVTTQRQERR
jgi:hypothetical protein